MGFCVLSPVKSGRYSSGDFGAAGRPGSRWFVSIKRVRENLVPVTLFSFSQSRELQQIFFNSLSRLLKPVFRYFVGARYEKMNHFFVARVNGISKYAL